MRTSRLPRHIAIASLFVGSLAVIPRAPAEEAARDSAASRGLFSKALRTFSTDAPFESQFDESFVKNYWRIFPDQAITAGEFAFAERIVVPDSRSRAKTIGRLNKWISQLHRFDPATLEPASRSRWYLLDNAFEGQRWELTEYREWQWNPAIYNVSESLALLLHADYAAPEQRLRTILARLADVSPYYAAAKQNISQPTREHTRLAIEENRRGLQVMQVELPRYIAGSSLRNSERALFTRRIAAACASIQDYISWLEALDQQAEQHGSRSARLGRELYERKFAFTIQSGGTADALHRRAMQEKGLLSSRIEQLGAELWPKHFAGIPAPAEPAALLGKLVAQLEQPQQSAQNDAEAQPSDKASNPIGAVFGNRITSNGWTAYNQLHRMESGRHSPEAWLLYYLSRLRSVGDALLDYGVHVGEMTEEQAMQLLTQEIYLPREVAAEKWDQAQLDSVQLVGNFAGFSEIYDLRESLKHEMGSRFQLSRFDEQLSNYADAPMKFIKDLLRPALLAHSLERDLAVN